MEINERDIQNRIKWKEKGREDQGETMEDKEEKRMKKKKL